MEINSGYALSIGNKDSPCLTINFQAFTRYSVKGDVVKLRVSISSRKYVKHYDPLLNYLFAE